MTKAGDTSLLDLLVGAFIVGAILVRSWLARIGGRDVNRHQHGSAGQDRNGDRFSKGVTWANGL